MMINEVHRIMRIPNGINHGSVVIVVELLMNMSSSLTEVEFIFQCKMSEVKKERESFRTSIYP